MVSTRSACLFSGTGRLLICTRIVLLQPSVICQLRGLEQAGVGQERDDGNQGQGVCSPVMNRKNPPDGRAQAFLAVSWGFCPIVSGVPAAILLLRSGKCKRKECLTGSQVLFEELYVLHAGQIGHRSCQR